MNNPLSGTDPSGYESDLDKTNVTETVPVTGSHIKIDPTQHRSVNGGITVGGFLVKGGLGWVPVRQTTSNGTDGGKASRDGMSKDGAGTQNDGIGSQENSNNSDSSQTNNDSKETADESPKSKREAGTTLGLNQSAVFAGQLHDTKGLKRRGMIIGTGTKLKIVASKTVVVSTSSSAGPLPTHQWRFTVHAWPLDAAGERQNVAAGHEWFDPVQATTMTGGASVDLMFRAVGTAPGGFEWTIAIPKQSSAHDNAGPPTIVLYEY